MSNEASIRMSLTINKGKIQYQSQPGGFDADVLGTKGPCIGAVTIPTYGKDIDLSELTVPGWAFIQNEDDTNYVEYGIREPENGRFYPMGELDPGQFTIFKFTRNIRQEYQGTGTGTSAPTNFFHIKANKSSCNVLLQVFEA